MAVPGTSARRGKRIKVRLSCRQCKREHKARYQAKRDGLRRGPAKLRLFCNGVWDT